MAIAHEALPFFIVAGLILPCRGGCGSPRGRRFFIAWDGEVLVLEGFLVRHCASKGLEGRSRGAASYPRSSLSAAIAILQIQ